jgi:hypothetical protein
MEAEGATLKRPGGVYGGAGGVLLTGKGYILRYIL